MRLGIGFRFGVFTVEDQFTYDRQGLARRRIDVVVGPARPQCIFIELQAFTLDTAKNHGAQPAVAHWIGFHPLTCRLVIPQHRRRFCRALGRSTGHACDLCEGRRGGGGQHTGHASLNQGTSRHIHLGFLGIIGCVFIIGLMYYVY